MKTIILPAVLLAAAGCMSQGSGPKAAPVKSNSKAIATVTDEALLAPGKDATSWITYGGNYANTRFDPSKLINTKNVSSLVVRRVIQTGGPIGSFETTPLVVDGIMYSTTPYANAFATDLRTGKTLWRYDHKSRGSAVFCCGPNNRGMAIHEDSLFLATLDGRLVGLNRLTGKKLFDVQVSDPAFGYSYTLAPLYYKGKVIIGVAGAEFGVRGFVSAHDAKTGAEAWRFWTIPETGWEGSFSATTPEGDNLHRDIAKEKADLAKYKDAWKTGGGSMWMTPAVDAETETLFLTIGNPSPDLDGAARPGDNLYSESMVALDVTTGKYKWHYQYVPHDVWDLDAVNPAILFDTTVDGKSVKAVGHAGKTGWYYVHERSTGKLIRRSDAFVPQENMFAQPTAEGTRMLPGANGGSEWSPASYSPVTNYVYIAALHQPMNYITQSAAYKQGTMWLGSAFVGIPGEEQYGLFVAVDVNSGKVAWSKKLPGPLIGGSVVNAGGLVFTGGDGTGNFYAFDAKTGEELWRFPCGAGVNAAPIAFELDGEPMIAVAAGGNFQLRYEQGDTIFVFGLPQAH